MIVVTGLCDLVKTVVDVIDDSSEVPNYQIISPIVLLLSAVSVCACVCAYMCVCRGDYNSLTSDIFRSIGLNVQPL